VSVALFLAFAAGVGATLVGFGFTYDRHKQRLLRAEGVVGSVLNQMRADRAGLRAALRLDQRRHARLWAVAARNFPNVDREDIAGKVARWWGPSGNAKPEPQLADGRIRSTGEQWLAEGGDNDDGAAMVETAADGRTT
jgi:hypothetical protein